MIAESAEHTQAQGAQLENIELHMSTARDNTAGGASEVLVASQYHRRGTKWTFWVLLAIVVAVVIIVVIIIRATK